MVFLHPLIDNGITPGDPSFPGGTLTCHCPSSPITLSLSSNVLHNHLCGCSKCWRPATALFSIVAVIPRTNLTITSNPDKLHITDPTATIQRHTCRDCGVCMFGRIEKDHPFKGLDFVHVELSDQKGWQEVQFAAFVSSVLEQGLVDKEGMGKVRGRLGELLGEKVYDCLSPGLMDAIGEWTAKQKGLLE